MEHLDTPAWRTSSYSGGNGGACIEVASHGGIILVRDTKNHAHGPVLEYTPAAWRAFIANVCGSGSGSGLSLLTRTANLQIHR
ncbi:MAG TPA: DUF397 domain-containing protein [Streptosporangiaceae bacterium]|nr:DUF397 domain-containing protein [Streptosporangiaceae bacterium]